MPSAEILEYRVSQLEGAIGEIKSAVKSIDASLQSLARLEARHAETRDALERAFDGIKELKDVDIKDHETRLREIEENMPTVKLVRNWVITGVLGVLAMSGTVFIKVLF